jgi:predicted ester cyclase
MTAEPGTKAFIVELFDRVINERRLDRIEEYFHPEYVEHSPMGEMRGTEAFRQYLAGWLEAFPDGHTEISDIVVDGDLAYWTVHFTGTNSGSFNGLPPTGKRVEMTEINKGLLRDGKAYEHWNGDGVIQTLSQLGLMQPPVPAGA